MTPTRTLPCCPTGVASSIKASKFWRTQLLESRIEKNRRRRRGLNHLLKVKKVIECCYKSANTIYCCQLYVMQLQLNYVANKQCDQIGPLSKGSLTNFLTEGAQISTYFLTNFRIVNIKIKTNAATFWQLF